MKVLVPVLQAYLLGKGLQEGMHGNLCLQDASHVLCRSPRTPIYSDRFIPSRATSSRLEGYTLLDRAEVAQDNTRMSEREEANGAYNQLLRSELLGLPSQSTPDRHGGASSGFISPTSR